MSTLISDAFILKVLYIIKLQPLHFIFIFFFLIHSSENRPDDQSAAVH